MPTGYTAAIQDGKISTLAEFMRHCAPNFILDLRDAGRDAPIPRTSECQESGVKWAKERAEAALNEIHRLHGLDDLAAEREARSSYDEEVARIEKRRANKAESKTRYERMLTQVRAWDAPERMHALRDFMIQQIEESIRFDCSPSSYDIIPAKQSGADWLAARIAAAQEEHESALKEQQAAETRLANWNGYYALFHAEIERMENLQASLSETPGVNDE